MVSHAQSSTGNQNKVYIVIYPIYRRYCNSIYSNLITLHTENVYDEPSLVLPDPIYQELSIKASSHDQTNIEMKGNCSYMATRITADSVTMLECPAYIRHKDLY